MEKNRTKQWSRPRTRTMARLAIQYAYGVTKKNRPAHRTFSLKYVRPEVTREEIIYAINQLQAIFIYPITGVKLVVEKVTYVWTPEMRENENEAEEELSSAAQAQRQTAQASAANMSSAPAAQTAQVQAMTVVQGEAPTRQEVPKIDRGVSSGQAGESAVSAARPAERTSFFARLSDFFAGTAAKDEATAQQAETVEPTEDAQATASGEQLPDLSHLLTGTEWDPNPATRTQPPAGLGFCDQLRRNNYQIRPEEMFRNPFADTVTNKGYERPAEKIDVPPYAEQTF